MHILSLQSNMTYRVIGIERHSPTNHWYLLYSSDGFDSVDRRNGSCIAPEVSKMEWFAEDMTLEEVIRDWDEKSYLFVHGEDADPGMYHDRYILVPESNEAALGLLKPMNDYK